MCNKCRYVFALEADFEQFYTFVPPLTCPNPDGCNSQRFCCLSGVSEPGACRDYQEIKIQEQVRRILTVFFLLFIIDFFIYFSFSPYGLMLVLFGQ